MNIILKGLYASSKKIPFELRGRTYEIARVKAGLTLSGHKKFQAILTLSDSKLSKRLKYFFEGCE